MIQRATLVGAPVVADFSGKGSARLNKAVEQGDLVLSKACRELAELLQRMDLLPDVSPHTKKGQGTTGTDHQARNAAIATKFSNDVLEAFNKKHGTNFNNCTDALRYLKKQSAQTAVVDRGELKEQEYQEVVKVKEKSDQKSFNYGTEKKAKKTDAEKQEAEQNKCTRFHAANRNHKTKSKEICPVCGKKAFEK
jgi:ribosomal protein S21